MMLYKNIICNLLYNSIIIVVVKYLLYLDKQMKFEIRDFLFTNISYSSLTFSLYVNELVKILIKLYPEINCRECHKLNESYVIA